jgi:hypothetical protein
MKESFETQKFNDKVLVSMFADNKKVSSVWKMLEGSNYVNLQELKDQMELRYIMENQPDEGEGE